VEAFEDSRGVLWFGTINRCVARYDRNALTYPTEKDGLCGDTIASIAEDKDGALWFAGHTGVCRYDGQIITLFFNEEGGVRTDRSGTSGPDRSCRFGGRTRADLEGVTKSAGARAGTSHPRSRLRA
jgi:ligand-binding sensor domain-containing protein